MQFLRNNYKKLLIILVLIFGYIMFGKGKAELLKTKAEKNNEDFLKDITNKASNDPNGVSGIKDPKGKPLTNLEVIELSKEGHIVPGQGRG